MRSEIVPDDGSDTSLGDDSDEDSSDSDPIRYRLPQGGSGAMEGVRPLDLLDLRAVGNPMLKADLIGGDYQINQFLASEKGHKYVTMSNPTPNSIKPLLDKVKEPSMLLLQGCTELLLQQSHFPFDKFKTLTALEISGCRHMTAVPEEAISQMTQLQSLNLSHLPIQHLSPEFLSNLKNLRSLAIRSCPNLHSIPKYAKLTTLQCLDLSDLLVETLPGPLYEFPELRWIILRGCSKLRSFPPTGPLMKLEALDLSHCTALKEMDDFYLWFRKLRMLDLSYTALPRVPRLNDPDCLTHLFLRDTQVGKLIYLKRVKKLQVLDLSGAQNVRRFDRLQGNKDLVALDLSRTGIESVDFLSDLIHLRNLILRECTGLVKLPAMKRLTNLEVLDMSGCEMLDDLPEDLSSLGNLKELNISCCSCLKELREGLFDHMSCLEKLNLSETNVNHLPMFTSLVNLHKLSLKGLELDSLESLTSLSNLVELDLSGLNITSPQELIFDFLEGIKNLRLLNLSRTSVEKLPDMSKLINLRELIVADCRELKVVPQLRFPKNLEILDLSLPDDYTLSNFQEESGSEDQLPQFLSSPDNLRKLILANRPGVLKLFPSESLGKLEHLDIHGTNEIDPVGVSPCEEVAGVPQGKVSNRNEFHIVSTFMSNSGFERFKYEFAKVDDLISNIQKSFSCATEAVGTNKGHDSFDAVIRTNFQSRALKMRTDLRYILQNIDLLESARNGKTIEGLLNDLMDAATHLSADDFPLDSPNLKELHRMVVKLKLLLPPKQVDGLEITKEVKKIKARFMMSKNEETDINEHAKDPEEKSGLLSSYELLTPIEKKCLLCFSVFPSSVESLEENTPTGLSKCLVIKKRVLVHWWFGEKFIDPQHEEKPKTIEEIGKQILNVLEEKGFIETVMNQRRDSASCCMRPLVHIFVTAQAKEEGFFDFDHKYGKLTPHFTRSGRACLLKIRDKFSSSCRLWANYDDSSRSLEKFKTIRTLFNVNESVVYIKAEWFSKMKDLYVLHLGSWRFETEEYIEVVEETFLDELKNMKQLRLFNLQGFSTIRKLPDSICKVTNLRILNLRDCTYLEELPAGIGSLKNLTHLDLTHCPIISKLPKGLGLLSKLEVLKGFVIIYQVGGQQHRKACTLRELLKLDNLRNLALAVNVEKFPDNEDLLVFKEMKNLCNLEITWEKNYNIHQEAQKNVTGHEVLRHSRWQKLKCWEQQTQRRQNDEEESSRSNHLDNLRKLVLNCFPLKTAPSWLDPAKLQKLEKLYIIGGNLETLPGDTNQNTWNVKILRLKYLPFLYSNWVRLRGMFPKMTYFEHHKCDQLTLFPPGVWTENDEK